MPPNMRVGGAYPDVFFTLADPYRLILCAQEQRQLGRSQRGGWPQPRSHQGLVQPAGSEKYAAGPNSRKRCT